MAAEPIAVADLRRNYARGGLVEGDLLDDPFAMFQRWLADAVAADLYEPNAMVVASVSTDGQPSSRMVLLKGFDERGFVFFTNLGSRQRAGVARGDALRVAVSVAPAGAPGSRGGRGFPGVPGRCRGVLRHPPTRFKVGRLGIESVARGVRTRRTRRGVRRRRGTLSRRGSGPRGVGRVPSRANGHRILAGSSGPDA